MNLLATHFLGAMATLLLQEWLACSSFPPTLFSFSSPSFNICCCLLLSSSFTSFRSGLSSTF